MQPCILLSLPALYNEKNYEFPLVRGISNTGIRRITMQCAFSDEVR